MKKLQNTEMVLSNKELLEFTNSLAGELTNMATGRGLHALLPALRSTVASSKSILDKMKN